MNRLRFWHSSAALAVLWIASCGSRSALYGPAGDGSGGGGAGGAPTSTTSTTSTSTTSVTTTSTTTSTTSTGGGGTGGGLPGPCGVLTYAKPFAALTGGSQSHQRFPKFAYSSADKADVTMATGWQVVDGPGPNPPIDIRHTSLAPWGDFPAGAGLGPTYLADFDGGVSFAIAQGNGKHFALLYRDVQSPSPELLFWDKFKPYAGDTPQAAMLTEILSADTAMFLTQGTSDYLFGAATKQVDGAYVMAAGLVQGDIYNLGCAFDVPPLAEAVPIGSDFLVVSANGTGTGANSCYGGLPVSFSVRVSYIQSAGFASIVELAFDKTTDVGIAARSDGAWAVWTSPGGEDLPPSLRFTRIDAMGQPYGPTWSWPATFASGSVTAQSFDDFLVLGWIEPDASGGQSPHIQVFDPEGNARGDIVVQATGTAKGHLAMLGSPITHSVLLAWSETVADPSLGDQVRITRVDCLDN